MKYKKTTIQIMKIKKNHLYGALVLFVVALVAISMSLLPHSPKSSGASIQPTPTTAISSEDALPISSKHPNVVNATAFYTFVGPITNLTDTEIAIKSDSTPLPTFTILADTDYYEIINGQPQKIDKQLVTSTSVVNLTVGYNYQNKQWTLNRITLVPPPTVTPAP